MIGVVIMLHEIKNVTAFPSYKLSVWLLEGIAKIYDTKPLLDGMSPKIQTNG